MTSLIINIYWTRRQMYVSLSYTMSSVMNVSHKIINLYQKMLK